MAKKKTDGKEKKLYKIISGDGKFTFQMLVKSPDGLIHSIQVPYPMTNYADGKHIKLSRKQTENYCLKHAQENDWFPATVDGK